MHNYINFYLLVFFDEICVTYIKLIIKIKAYKIIFRFLLKFYFKLYSVPGSIRKTLVLSLMCNYCCGVFFMLCKKSF